MSQTDGQVASFDVDLDRASNVLLLVPSMEWAGDEGCAHLMEHGDLGETAGLCVTLNGSPDNRLDALRAHLGGDMPSKLGVVSVGDTTRSTAATGGGPVTFPDRGLTIETISSPADLTGVGIKVTNFLSGWADEEEQISVCFYTLTTLLQYVDLQDVFRFLHVLTGRLKAVDAIAHFHMDPTAHDERSINTLKSLFDGVVELDDTGEWVVRTR